GTTELAGGASGSCRQSIRPMARAPKGNGDERVTARLGMPVPGGHRFGDDLAALRVRLSTGPLLGTTAEEREQCLQFPAPLELPHLQRALNLLGSVFDDLRDDAQRWEPPR
ncbi:pyridoxal phosphate-dependent aminotransferase, partial [Streptomyces sp. NPDC001215]